MPFTSILKTTISSQVFATNNLLGARMLATNSNDDIVSGDESNDRLKRVEPKTGKTSKVQKFSKSRKFVKSKKPSKVGIHPILALRSSDRAFKPPKLGQPLTAYN